MGARRRSRDSPRRSRSAKANRRRRDSDSKTRRRKSKRSRSGDRTRRERKDSRRRSPSKRRSRRRRSASPSKRRSRRRRSPSKHSEDDFVSDEDMPGLPRYRVGDVIEKRYRILELAGKGTFGTALYVYDLKQKEEVAMKIVRSVERYLEDAQVEIDILKQLTDGDPEKKNGIVRLRESFKTRIRGRKHVCLILDKLGKSLCDIIEKNNLNGFTMAEVREFGRQMFEAVAYCHKHKLTHTDLKPENILLCDKVRDTPDGRGWVITSTNTKMIDFGGATYEDEYHASMINTRQYRAPEVMLALGWSYPSDIWSAGCMLPELLKGIPLFSTHADQEHFALMQKILGKTFDPTMTLQSLENYKHNPKRLSRSPSRAHSSHERGRSPSVVPVDRIFDRAGKLKWPDKASDSSRARVERARPLREQFQSENFIDLLEKCLVLDPKKRLTAQEALRHPFFTEPLDGDS